MILAALTKYALKCDLLLVYTQIGMLFNLKNSEILTFETVWMNLENIMLNASFKPGTESQTQISA